MNRRDALRVMGAGAVAGPLMGAGARTMPSIPLRKIPSTGEEIPIFGLVCTPNTGEKTPKELAEAITPLVAIGGKMEAVHG